MTSETKNSGASARHWKVAVVRDAHVIDGVSHFPGINDREPVIDSPSYKTDAEAVARCHEAGRDDDRAILYVVENGKMEKTTCFMRGRVFAWDGKDAKWYDVEGEEWAVKVDLVNRMRLIPGEMDAADPCAGN